MSPAPLRSSCQRVAALVASIYVLTTPVARSESDFMVPSSPVGVDLELVTGGSVVGTVLAYTNDCIVVEFRKDPHAVPWAQVETGSAYRARRLLFEEQRGGRDQLTAEDHYLLGLFALTRDRLQLARREFKEAVALDERVQGPVDASLQAYQTAQERTQRVRLASPPPATQPVAVTVHKPDEWPKVIDEAIRSLTKDENATTQPAMRQARMTELYKQFGQSAGRVLDDELVLIETEHFLIWTDWRPIHHGLLAALCERAYAELIARFDRLPEEAIFLGKCPVFCFRNKAAYKKLAREFDDYDATQSLGYTRMVDNGHVHLALYRKGDSQADVDRFAAALVHESCHAFVHRLHSNHLLTGWVSEGLANHMTERVLREHCPFGETADVLARVYVSRNLSVLPVLRSDDQMPTHYYPIAHSLVSYLIREDAEAFNLMIADIKQGGPTHASMARRYDGLTYELLEQKWRKDVLRRASEPEQPALP